MGLQLSLNYQHYLLFSPVLVLKEREDVLVTLSMVVFELELEVRVRVSRYLV